MRKVFLLIAFIILNNLSYSQLTVTGNNVANQLVQDLVGFGVTFSNATLDCGPNSQNPTDYGSGIFTVTTSNLGLDSGIILTSGTAATSGTATGANGGSALFASTAVWPFATAATSGDPDLTQLIGGATRDRCVLEFDFVTIGDSVKFNYVFGSEEYTSYTCSSFNDVFGFFLSGPGITGPYSNNSKNLALVPGSTTCPVAISTIFCPNSPGCCQTTNYCFGNTPGCGAFNATNNTCAYFVCNGSTSNPGTSVTYNGFTTVLRAESQVIPCSTYHIKLAIADKADQVLDSGVFLQAGSFSSNVVDVTLNTGLTSSNGTPVIVEGCDTAFIKVTRKIVNGVANADTLNILVQGTATPIIDYGPAVPGQITFTANATDTMRQISLSAIADGITEGTETIKIYVLSGCALLPIDSLIIEVKDQLDFNLTNPDVAICLGQSVNTTGTTDLGINFQWTPGGSVADPTQFLTTITPTAVGVQTYILTGTAPGCPTISDQFTITTDPVPSISPMPDLEVCEGKTVDITAYVNPPFNYNYNWNPSSGLTNINGTTATFNGTQTQNITFTATSPNAGCTSSDDFTVTVWPFLAGTISEDTLVCNAEPVQLWVSGGIGQYQWYPAATLSCEFCPNPIATALGTTIYYAILLEPHGCQDTLDVIVENHPPFNLQLLNVDTTIVIGESVELIATGAPYYYWSPTKYMTYTQGSNPLVTPLETTTYVVTGVSALQGCPQKDSVTITVIEKDVWLPNAFTPNGDGKNDIFKIIMNGKLVQVQEFRIFNRWGQEIFYTKDIRQGWDGNFKGKPQNPDVYNYLIRVAYPTGRSAFMKGDFTLIR